MSHPDRPPPRGLLQRSISEKHFRLARYPAAQELDLFVEAYWIVRWDLRGQRSHLQENLPHPSVHLAIEPGRSEIVGVVERKYARRLEGRGRVVGVKFRPGGFYGFFGSPVASITNRVLSVGDVFDEPGRHFVDTILATEEDDRIVALCDEFLLAQHPKHDGAAMRAGEIVRHIVTHPDVRKVDGLASTFGISKRQLQRLFHRYIGVSPKWVIQRYRLHEALDQVERDDQIDWSALASDLGYFDQAHFIRDFKALIGKTPGEYSQERALSASGQPRTRDSI